MDTRRVTTLHDSTTDEVDERSTRRALLGRLAGLGLVAAGSMALLPGDAAAKPKHRAKRNQRAKRNARTNRAKLTSQALVIVGHPTVRADILIAPSIPVPGSWRVVVAGSVSFNASQIAAMKLGYKYRVHGVVWEYDGVPFGDFCYNLPVLPQHVYPKSRTAPASVGQFAFFNDVSSATLNKDVGQDEVYARITLWRQAPGRAWLPVSYTSTVLASGEY